MIQLSLSNLIVVFLTNFQKLVKFKEVAESIEPDLHFEWQKAVLIMQPRIGVEVLFLDAGTPGAYRAVIKQEQREKGTNVIILCPLPCSLHRHFRS